MGTVQSTRLKKLQKYLCRGDEPSVLSIVHSSTGLRTELDPNVVLGTDPDNNTPLHWAARHAMAATLQLFLKDLAGNPNLKNNLQETCLHLACKQEPSGPRRDKGREKCVQMLIQWQDSGYRDSSPTQAHTLDQSGNTPLHVSAKSGLFRCARLLIQYDPSILFCENSEKQTAFDLSVSHGHTITATFLEMMMFYAKAPEIADESCFFNLGRERFNALRSQDLQEYKDELIVETSVMLNVRLFEAEALLKAHSWSEELVAEAWINDKDACREKSGLQKPIIPLPFSTVFPKLLSNEEGDNHILASPYINISSDRDKFCEICFKDISQEEFSLSLPCMHLFCKECWKMYLSDKIETGTTFNILCPAFECLHIVPVDIMDRVVSRGLMRRYLRSDIDAFVEGHPRLKWCPFPGCGLAVRLMDGSPSSSNMADCGNGHYFCWTCGTQAHDPCSCELWNEWVNKMAAAKDKDIRVLSKEENEAANNLWLVTNSKPCPSCKVLIEKNEGCNVIRCFKCHYIFCWVCLKGWETHTSDHFNCFRYKTARVLQDEAKSKISEAAGKKEEIQDLKTFVDFHQIFQSEEKTLQHELLFLKRLTEKVDIVHFEFPDANYLKFLGFLKAGILKTLWARRVLSVSYAYSYFNKSSGANLTLFDIMRNDLREKISKMSQQLDQPYFKMSYENIVLSFGPLHLKLKEFLDAVSNGIFQLDNFITNELLENIGNYQAYI